MQTSDVPSTACGQCVTLFMKGYMVTSDRDEAPRKMLYIPLDEKVG